MTGNLEDCDADKAAAIRPVGKLKIPINEIRSWRPSYTEQEKLRRYHWDLPPSNVDRHLQTDKLRKLGLIEEDPWAHPVIRAYVRGLWGEITRGCPGKEFADDGIFAEDEKFKSKIRKTYLKARKLLKP